MKLKLSAIVTAASLAILTGCATITLDSKSTVSLKTGQTPALNKLATASVGGVMYSQFRYWSRTGYRLDEPVNLTLGLGRVVAPQGTFLVRATRDTKLVCCTEERTYIDPLVGPHAISCFEGTSNHLTRVSATPGMVAMSKDLPNPVGFSISELVTIDDTAFKYELFYQGNSRNTLRISYRKFYGTSLDQRSFRSYLRS